MKIYTIRKYKGCYIHPPKFTTMGYLYEAYCLGTFLRADTLQGMKNIITNRIKKI